MTSPSPTSRIWRVPARGGYPGRVAPLPPSAMHKLGHIIPSPNVCVLFSLVSETGCTVEGGRLHVHNVVVFFGGDPGSHSCEQTPLLLTFFHSCRVLFKFVR